MGHQSSKHAITHTENPLIYDAMPTEEGAHLLWGTAWALQEDLQNEVPTGVVDCFLVGYLMSSNGSEARHLQTICSTIWVLYQTPQNANFILRFEVIKNIIRDVDIGTQVETSNIKVSKLSLQDCIISHRFGDDGIEWQIENGRYTKFFERTSSNASPTICHETEGYLALLGINEAEITRVEKIVTRRRRFPPGNLLQKGKMKDTYCRSPSASVIRTTELVLKSARTVK